jgi:hypothetical protein
MTKDEALKMAIEALETADAIDAEYSGVYFERIQPTSQACKEALADNTQKNSGEAIAEVCIYPMGVSNGVNMWLKTPLAVGNYKLYLSPQDQENYLISVIADIRQVTGLGCKTRLSELAEDIRKLINQPISTPTKGE